MIERVILALEIVQTLAAVTAAAVIVGAVRSVRRRMGRLRGQTVKG